MKFKIDENLPHELRVDFRRAGYDAETVAGEGLAGATDSLLLETVKQEGRIFLTLDKGIADVHAYPPERFPGIVLFRPSASGTKRVRSLVRNFPSRLEHVDLAGRLAVVTERNVRLRQAPRFFPPAEGLRYKGKACCSRQEGGA